MEQKINSQLLMMMLVLMRSLRLQLVKDSKTKTGFFVLFLSGPEQFFWSEGVVCEWAYIWPSRFCPIIFHFLRFYIYVYYHKEFVLHQSHFSVLPLDTL